MRRWAGARGPQRLFCDLSEDYYGAGERRGMFRTFKTNPPTQEMDLTVAYYEFMPPCRICSGRNQAHNTFRVAHLDFPHSLGDPTPDFPAIRRIHPADAIPGLQQAVHFRREIFSALGVLRCSAYVIIKRAVRKIPSAEQFPRRCPIHFLAGKMHVIKWGCRHDVSLWRPSCGAGLGREARRGRIR